MAKNAINGQPARYNASALSLTDGDALALQTDSTGALITTSGSGGSAGQVQGTAADNAPATGNPVLTGAEYNVTPPTYADGDVANNQADVNGNLKVTQTTSTAVVTSVADTATSTTLVAASTTAKERIIQNDSASILYVKFGTTASATDYTVKLLQDDVLTTQYIGRIDGIWSADSTGAAKITELS